MVDLGSQLEMGLNRIFHPAVQSVTVRAAKDKDPHPTATG